jgi:hypothetical protein
MFSAISMQVHKLVTKMRFQGKEGRRKLRRLMGKVNVELF